MLAFFEKIPLTAKLERLFWLLYHSASVRVIILLALTAYAYYPFFSSNNMGNRDAQYYQYMLHDALIQLQRGEFPCYVGQSVFSPLGSTCILAPLYILNGQLINVLTFGALNPLLVQHLTIFYSAFLAAIIFYLVIRSLAPNLYWKAVFLSFSYIACPGVIAFPYSLDMYFSMMAVPFIPLLLFGLVQISKKNDYSSYVITAVAAAFLLMAHAPIALLTYVFAVITCIPLIFFRPKRIIPLFITGILLIGLCIWEVIPVLQLYSMFEPGKNLTSARLTADIRHAIEQLLLNIPDTFLPLRTGKNNLSFLQLGYTLWAFMGIAIFCLFKKSKEAKQIRLLMPATVIFILMIYPVYKISEFIWHLLPGFLITITSQWPNQRITAILSAAIIMMSALGLQGLSMSKRTKNNAINLLLIALFLWNISELQFFINRGAATKVLIESQSEPKNYWSKSDNVFFFSYSVPVEFILNGFTLGNHNAQLMNNFFDEKRKIISGSGNEAIAIAYCLSQKNAKEMLQTDEDLKEKMTAPIFLANLRLSPNTPYLVCIDQDSYGGDIHYQIIDENYRERAVLQIPVGESVTRNQKIALPFYFEDQSDKTKDFTLQVWSPNGANLKLSHLNTLSNYLNIEYPVQIRSFTPYIASVKAKQGQSFLEVVKIFENGYQATVNGKEVKLEKSFRNTILVPLHEGVMNEITLRYVGTVQMRIALFISIGFWCLIMIFVLLKIRQYILVRKFNK